MKWKAPNPLCHNMEISGHLPAFSCKISGLARQWNCAWVNSPGLRPVEFILGFAENRQGDARFVNHQQKLSQKFIFFA
jgi:hypothetical protein